MELIRPDINLDFVGKRKVAFLISGLLILMTFVTLFIKGGPNYGIDFAGGITVQVRFDKPTSPTEIKKALTPVGMDQSMVQAFEGKDNEYLIRNEREGLKLENIEGQLRDALAKVYGQGFEVRRVEMVGPKVGGDLRRQALLAIFYALLLIAVYISGRFEGKWVLAAVMAGVLVGATILVQTLLAAWGEEGGGTVWLIITSVVVTLGACFALRLRYALGAIVALIHDVVITVGVFSLLDKEFTLATVAALLTIIGYSLNDTIIIFDRIRENLRKGGRRELGEVINESVNQTLSRTIITSGTTIVVLICLYVLGGGVIEDFAFALLIGVVVGTYSSIFVASPVLLAMPEGQPGLGLAKPGGRPVKVKASAAPPQAASPARPASPVKSAARKKRPRKKRKR